MGRAQERIETMPAADFVARIRSPYDKSYYYFNTKLEGLDLDPILILFCSLTFLKKKAKSWMMCSQLIGFHQQENPILSTCGWDKRYTLLILFSFEKN